MRPSCSKALFLDALKDGTENVYSLARKSASHNRFETQKSMPFGKKTPNIYKKVVTYLAETTPSQVGICGNLGNRGKLYSEHALPRLLWYLSISKRQLLCINYSDLCKLLRLKRNDWVTHPKT